MRCVRIQKGNNISPRGIRARVDHPDNFGIHTAAMLDDWNRSSPNAAFGFGIGAYHGWCANLSARRQIFKFFFKIGNERNFCSRNPATR
jgi:hypothetical protein